MRFRRLFAGFATLALAAGVGTVTAASAQANGTTVPWPEGVVHSTDLIAGQHTDVGTVNVKYAGDMIYVQAVLDPGWCAVDIAAAANYSDYSNKAGNPKVGHFPLQQSYDPCTGDTGWLSFPMPDGWDYTVALHATVAYLEGATTHEISSAVGDTIYGPYSTPGELPGSLAGSAVAVPQNSAWAHPGGTWISTSAGTSGDVVDGCVTDTYRQVVKSVNIDGYLFDVSDLSANADNAESVMLNGQALTATAGNPGVMTDGPVTDDRAYRSVDTFPLPLTTGDNTLTVTFRNYGVPDLSACYSAASNPTGVAFHATYKVASTDTAWASGTAWGGANWAMYIQLPSAMTTVQVPADEVAGVPVSLDSGSTYLLYVTGMWTNKSGTSDQFDVDASCVSYDGWATALHSPTGMPDGQLSLQLDEADVNWGSSCNSAHVYMTTYTATGSPLNLRIFDGQGGAPVSGWYGDNHGYLTVTFYEIG